MKSKIKYVKIWVRILVGAAWIYSIMNAVYEIMKPPYQKPVISDAQGAVLTVGVLCLLAMTFAVINIVDYFADLLDVLGKNQK